MSSRKENLQLLDDYNYYLGIENRSNESKRLNTVKTYYGHVKQFIDYLDDKDCLNVGIREADEWLTSLTNRDGKPIKDSTRNNKLAALNDFYSYLIDIDRVTDTNPFNGLKAIRIKKKGKRANQITREFLEIDEINRFKKLLKKNVYNPTCKVGAVKENAKMLALRDRAMFHLMLSTGLRVNEVCLLEKSELHVMKEENIVLVEVLEENDKGKRGREIPMPMDVYAYIEEYRNGITFKPENECVFLSQNGNPLAPAIVGNLLSEYMEKIGVEKHITPHSLRHSYATHLYNKTKNLKLVADMLGHANTDLVEEIYYHPTKEAKYTTLAI